jgi:hypothetical protein
VSYDELITIETPEDCEIKGCCDDTKVLIYGKDLKTIETKANKVLKDIFNWGQKVKLEFNASKTTALLITKKRDQNINLRMNGIQIELKDNIKYLGVFIDKKLYYNKHIEYLYDKLITKITKIPLMSRNTWGLRYDAMKVIYSAAIETSLLYCSSVWAKNLTRTNIN